MPVILSKRESECVRYVIQGKTAKEIAIGLHLSHRTIEYYMQKIKQKFSCRTKNELIVKALSLSFQTKED